MICKMNSLTGGVDNIRTINNQRLFIDHVFSKIKKRLDINSSLSYNRFDTQISSQVLLSENINIIEKTYVPGEEIIVFLSGFTSYIDIIETSVKLGYQRQHSNKPFIVDDQRVNFKNNVDRLYLSGTTYLEGPFNFKFLSQYENNRSRGNNSNVTNNRYKFQLQSIFKINKSFSLSLMNSGFIIDNEFYESSNLETEYKFNDERWTMSLIVNNLFNSKEYIFSNVFNFGQVATIFTSIPIYFSLSATYRF